MLPMKLDPIVYSVPYQEYQQLSYFVIFQYSNKSSNFRKQTPTMIAGAIHKTRIHQLTNQPKDGGLYMGKKHPCEIFAIFSTPRNSNHKIYQNSVTSNLKAISNSVTSNLKVISNLVTSNLNITCIDTGYYIYTVPYH